MTDHAGRDEAGKAYADFVSLLTLIELLIIPSRAKKQGIHRPRSDRWLLPMLCLVSRPDIGSPLELVQRFLAAPKRQAPHVRISATGRTVQTILQTVSEELARGAFGMDRLRFRHYALVEALLRVDLRTAPVDRQRRELTRQLRQELSGKLEDGESSKTPWVLGGWAGLVLWLTINVLPRMLFWMLTKGFLLGAGRRFGWLISQPYPVPRRPGEDFFTFASRLTVGARDGLGTEPVDRLLVHAFLEDLRVAYRRRPWRLAPWRRTAYPVILIDDAAPDNAGYALLRLVNDIRNKTRDPVLFVTNGAEMPADIPGLAGAVVRPAPVGTALTAFVGWCQNRGDSWYLPLEVPPVALDSYEMWIGTLRVPPPPLLARTAVLSALVICLLAAPMGWQAPEVIERERADCLWSAPWADGLVRTEVRDDECIGYSDHRRQIFGAHGSLLQIQEKIFAQNRAAEQAHRGNRDRPMVTLVYFGALTAAGAAVGEEFFAAEREELQGMAAAQHRAYLEARESRASPYLRIVIANAGWQMRHAGEVVRMLAELADDEPSLLGVVGLVESRQAVKDAIQRLGAINLPVIAPTLSADEIADSSSKYLQISASNLDESRFVHQHVTEVLEKREIFNYYTFGTSDQQQGEADDLYVNTLRQGLRAQFGEDYQESFWRDDVDLRPMCRDKFPDGVVFFGGRYGNFGAFARALASACSGKMPLLIGNDSVNRYMASLDLRQAAPENLPVAYVVKGALAYCDQLATAQDTERVYFRGDVQAVLSLCGPNTPIGERVGLAYDATRMLLKAVRTIASNIQPSGGPYDITPSAVYTQIRDMADPYHGVTGLIRFNANGIAVDKRLTMLCVPNLKRAFQSTFDVPREIDREPINEEENIAYDTPPPIRRACMAAD